MLRHGRQEWCPIHYTVSHARFWSNLNCANIYEMMWNDVKSTDVMITLTIVTGLPKYLRKIVFDTSGF